jgi:hypothetical protein
MRGDGGGERKNERKRIAKSGRKKGERDKAI